MAHRLQQHDDDIRDSGAMTPRLGDGSYDTNSYGGSYADSYATHYSAMSDDVGTPPGSGPTGDAGAMGSNTSSGAVPYSAFSDAMGGSSTGASGASSFDSYGSYANSGAQRFGSDLNVDMNSYTSSASALSPRSSDADSNPLGHSAFFGAAAAPHSGQFEVRGGSDVGTPRSPGSASGGGLPTPTPLHGARRSAADNRSVLSSSSQQQHATVPLSPGSRLSQQSKLSTLSKGSTFVGQKGLSRETARELAKTALSARATSIGDVTFEQPGEANLRDSIRRVQAYSRREAPIDYEMSAKMLYRRRPCEIRMDRDVISWYRGQRHKGSIDTDDVVGAEVPAGKPGYLRIHYFTQGRGSGAKALRRKPRTADFGCAPDVAAVWVQAIQELVRWQARAPPLAEKRRIKVVVNPHSGKRRARQIWLADVKPFFDLGQFECVVEETTHSGHGIEMGRQYSADDGFEALVFIGGDGTLCEFMNGLLSRPEHEWREIVVSTPLSLISAGTQNAFGVGVGIPTVAAAVYCILKRKIRPLDVITATAAREPSKVHYAYCGVGWGVAGDIAAESERYRWLGTARYLFLKAKRAAFLPKPHSGRVRYVPTDPQPRLCKYDDIRNDGALDQFEVEEGNVYDAVGAGAGGLERKSWGGFGGAVRSPASAKRYPEAAWTREEGRYMVVGVVNTAPDGAYAHPSDGNLDLIISRKGGLLRSLQLIVLYLVGREFESPLISYVKVKAVEIDCDQPDDCCNMDGEVLPGGPWRMEVVPSLFKALSEK
ncbi:hypothetical protein PybrP1_006018 [[Pythium] brassicae (nom. inval.)]|nr:hypothetical protein PybrP1_006018 [[Pythium] brassicae (nom. inval.)]